ncbi:hypothetical protein [Exercitatus varius]|uniref:hypothetical protein n=1 Tax=Exercitatus varius TaxID=67857 RepID=UPI00294AD03B|nr:hypothetical protein [Exercitatus varius]
MTGLFAEKKKAPKARKSALIKYFSILNVGSADGSEGASNRLQAIESKKSTEFWLLCEKPVKAAS